MSATSNMPDLRCDSEVAHQLVERRRHRSPHFTGQMRVDSRGARTAVAQMILNHPQVEASFQQMGGVGMAQCMHMRSLGDSAAFEGRAESTLQTAARDWTTVMRQAMGQTVPRRRGK